MLLTLLKALDTDDLMTVLKHLSMAPLDIDLTLYAAQNDGEVEIDKTTGKIKALKEPDFIYCDEVLADKLSRIISEYDRQEANITRSRLEQITLDLAGTHGYPIHDFICTMYAMEQGEVRGMMPLHKYDISVPAIKKVRPANTFTFYTYTNHQEFGAKAVNEYIDSFDKKSVK